MNAILYIDTYLIINALFNFTIITLSLVTNKIAVKLHRIAIIAFWGAILSLVIMFTHFPKVLLKIALSIIICTQLFKGTLKQKIKFIFTFYFYSYICAGIVLSVGNFSDIMSINNTSYTYVSTGVVCLSLIVILFLSKITQQLIAQQVQKPYNYKTVTITYKNTTLNLIGFCDSGNSLYDYDNMRPIFVADITILRKIPDIEFVRTFQCNTVSGPGEIKLFNPDKILINNTIVQATIGISNYEFKCDYDMLLTDNYYDEYKANIKNTETRNIYV